MTDGTPDAILGNFIPVGAKHPIVKTRRARSTSPSKRKRTDVGVHFHVSLTDSQMDRLAFAAPVRGSPLKSQHPHVDEPFRSPSSTKLASACYTPSSERGRTAFSHSTMASSSTASRFNAVSGLSAEQAMFANRRSSRSRSPSKRSASPSKSHNTPITDHNERIPQFQQPMPSPIAINTNPSPTYPPATCYSPGEASDESLRYSHLAPTPSPSRSAHSPLRRRSKFADSASKHESVPSVYSQFGMEEQRAAEVCPLRIDKHELKFTASDIYPYEAEAESPTPKKNQVRIASPTRVPGDEEVHNLYKMPTIQDLGAESKPLIKVFTPLTDYLIREVVPTKHKEMVGEKGWLERTGPASPDKRKLSTDSKSSDKRSTPSKMGNGATAIFDGLKKFAKDVSTRKLRPSPTEKDLRAPTTRLAISLNPREQSLFYAEIEYFLSDTVNDYIEAQFKAGRLDADKYKKVVDDWSARGHLKATGFRFDLETQLYLISLHCNDFRFYGKSADNLPQIMGLLDMNRCNARAIRVRTYCMPDPVIAKQLLDGQNLLRLLAANEQQQAQFESAVRFFKVILEREKHRRDEQGDGRGDEEGFAGGDHYTTAKRSKSTREGERPGIADYRKQMRQVDIGHTKGRSLDQQRGHHRHPEGLPYGT